MWYTRFLAKENLNPGLQASIPLALHYLHLHYSFSDRHAPWDSKVLGCVEGGNKK